MSKQRDVTKYEILIEMILANIYSNIGIVLDDIFL